MSDLVGNPEDRFSHNEAHIISILKIVNESRNRSRGVQGGGGGGGGGGICRIQITCISFPWRTLENFVPFSLGA